ELEWSVRGDLPELVQGDPIRLRQVLINLLGNAVKFTEAGEVLLGIECLKCNEEEAAIRFEVRDTGVGIPEEHHSRIFDAFQQSDSSVTRQFGGTGLGLSISARIVRMMGGEIQVESTAGKGSRFFFTVKLRTAKGAERADEEEGKLPRVKVLVVEESKSSQELAVWLMSRWGLEWKWREALRKRGPAWHGRKKKTGTTASFCSAKTCLAPMDTMWQEKSAPTLHEKPPRF